MWFSDLNLCLSSPWVMFLACKFSEVLLAPDKEGHKLMRLRVNFSVQAMSSGCSLADITTTQLLLALNALLACLMVTLLQSQSVTLSIRLHVREPSLKWLNNHQFTLGSVSWCLEHQIMDWRVEVLITGQSCSFYPRSK